MNSMVSIITPSYKSERFISKTIETVLNQTYKKWEMIIVDDLSPDNSNDIIEKYAKQDSRIKLIRLLENSGPAVARNRAIEEAGGRYIAFLDADDLWKMDKLEKQIDFMNENDLAFTYSSYDLIDEDDNTLGYFKTKEQITYGEMLKTSSVGCLTAIYDTNKIGKVYMPIILKRHDYALWLKILKKIGATKGLGESLAVYRIHDNSVSSNKLIAILYVWKVYREIEYIAFFKSIYYMLHFIINGIKKYSIKKPKKRVRNV